MRLLLLAALCSALSAQVFPHGIRSLHVGVKAGLRATGDLEGSTIAAGESKPYVIGAMAALDLPHAYAVELNALYSRLGYVESAGEIADSNVGLRYRGNSWEFPLVVRKLMYRSYFVGAGYSVRTISGMGEPANGDAIDPITQLPVLTRVPSPWKRVTHGPVVAVGMEWRWERVLVTPEVRYTRWARPALNRIGSTGSSLRSTQNQVQFLVGISF